jgi:hypothetical protein
MHAQYPMGNMLYISVLKSMICQSILWQIYRHKFASVSSSSFASCLLLDHLRIETDHRLPHAASLSLSISTNEINNGVFLAAVDDDDGVGFRGMVFGKDPESSGDRKIASDSKIDRALCIAAHCPFYNSNTDAATPLLFHRKSESL